MARELRPIDISNNPELLRLAEEVAATQEPRVLRRESEEVAVLMPAPPKKKRASRGRPVPRGKPTTEDDPLWNIIGLAEGPDDGITDVSANKLKYLAEAYTAQHE